MYVTNSISKLVGNTPVVKLSRIIEEDSAEVYVKLEYFNPGGSIKDRIALNMINKAEEEGKLKSGSVIIEPTSGNTGIGLAMIGASKGYKVILVMPDTMSIERRRLLKAYGAELILTPGEKGMKGAVDKAYEILRKNENYFMPQQFENLHNPEVHTRTTAEEIISQMEGKLDAFVAGVGTGGTISGVAQVIKKQIKSVEIIAVEPEKSPVLSGGTPGPHNIQGIGAGFIPSILKVELIDSVERITEEDAIETMRKLAKEEGILVGISAGAAVYVAIKKARELGRGKKVLAIAPDSGERYLSLGVFD